jgi:hypothetical protein
MIVEPLMDEWNLLDRNAYLTTFSGVSFEKLSNLPATQSNSLPFMEPEGS